LLLLLLHWIQSGLLPLLLLLLLLPLLLPPPPRLVSPPSKAIPLGLGVGAKASPAGAAL
jgi:hypothetical protein